MSLPAPYSEVYREGDGVTTEFSFGNEFKAISQNYVKCIVYLEDGYAVVPTYTVNLGVGSITISALTMPDSTVLTAPPLGSQVRIFRDVPEAQTVNASQIQSFTGKQLENVFDAIVAMIQEVSYTVDHKTVRLTEPQRDIALQELSELADNHLIYWDFTNRKLVVTNYPQQDVVQCVNGLFFRLRTDPDTQQPYLQWSTDNSDWHSIDVDAVRELAQSAYDLADSAYNLASTTRGELNAHKALRNNPHETSMNNLIDTNFNNLVSGQFLQFNGINWVNVDYNTTVAWGGIGGSLDNQADLKNALDSKVNLDGSSIMTGPLKMRATSSFQCAIAPYWDGVGFYKLNNDDSVTLIASIETPDGFLPWNTNTYNIGSSSKKWKNLYLGGKLFVSQVNNGGDLTFPANTTGTLATKADVDLAANSGRMITDQGVWYAKMYAATVAPAAEDGTNYADFSQVDGQGNPVIVTYNRVNGAWVQDQTITPPAEYDGYVPITSKIWDIVEQAGQQGGRILWNHQSKEFTPYPQIISFEDIEITGSSTVIMPYNPNANQIVNKNYVDTLVSNSIGDATITLTQSGQIMGSFTTNQSSDVTIALDATTEEKSIDAGIVGNLTVAANGDVSGFSNNDYLKFPGVLYMKDASSFEMVFAFVSGAVSLTEPILNIPMGSDTENYIGLYITVVTSPTENKSLTFAVNNGNVQQDIIHGTTQIVANTKYYGKVVYDGTDYTLYLSTDGTSWTTEGTTVARYLPGSITAGYNLGKSPDEAISTLCLSECYIKKNNVLIWQGIDAPGLHQRASNLHEVIAFQAPKSSNNYTWYRKYRDGWVEMGGVKTSVGSAKTLITLPIEMADNNYIIVTQGGTGADGYTNAQWQVMPVQTAASPKTTTSFYAQVSIDGYNLTFFWEVRGMAA